MRKKVSTVKAFDNHIAQLRRQVIAMCEAESPNGIGKGINAKQYESLSYAHKSVIYLMEQANLIELDEYGWYVVKGHVR